MERYYPLTITCDNGLVDIADFLIRLGNDIPLL